MGLQFSYKGITSAEANFFNMQKRRSAKFVETGALFSGSDGD